ncbi:uncharacterized protein BKCO1_19000125 [Diplodia corticola]|uniref:Uncharacterized protein n=1 Tax=Diplodia corticola TaxID=236234 RepID=A0A1J9R362_9PEZI|nr:uncharacterized protein BKCO1_19000125 [Diplodia corticola]OJD35048.1 hypothetical protein BKCO1_19000125 [Diplodia corticola]
MIPQMPFRFYGSLEASFLTAAEPTSYAYSPRSSVYSSSTALYKEHGPQIIEPHPPTRRAASEDGQAASASEPGSSQGDAAGQSKAPSEPASSRSSSRNSSRNPSPKRAMNADLLSSAPRMNATRLMG